MSLFESPEAEARRAQWRAFCARGEAHGVPLFQQAWWLDAACGAAGWTVLLHEDGGRIVAALPLALRRRGRLPTLGHAPFSPWAGPWIAASSSTHPARARAEARAALEVLARALPESGLYAQNWDPRNLDALPFHAAGCLTLTRWTHVLEDIGDTERIWEGFRDTARREIRKAEGRAGLAAAPEPGSRELLRLWTATFARQGRLPPAAPELLAAILGAAEARGQGAVIVARDGDGRAHAAAAIVWDEARAWYLAGGADPALRVSGAGSLCLWKAIGIAAHHVQSFDFEGSMEPAIARHFASFGARPVPYLRVVRARGMLARSALAWSALRHRL